MIIIVPPLFNDINREGWLSKFKLGDNTGFSLNVKERMNLESHSILWCFLTALNCQR